MKHQKRREQRKHLEKLRKAQFQADKKHRLEHVLSTLGLLKGYRDLPGWARDDLIKMVSRPPKVVISPDTYQSHQLEILKEMIESILEEDITILGHADGSITLADALGVLFTLPIQLLHLASGPLSQKHKDLLVSAAEQVRSFQRAHEDSVFKHLSSAIMTELLDNSRIDGTVVGCYFHVATDLAEDPPIRFTLVGTTPQEIRIAIDGNVRPAFRCALPEFLKGTRWVEVDGGAFGLEAGRKYPVYIQSHAAYRLRERLSATELPGFTIFMGLCYSLAKPTAIEPNGDRCLIDFNLRGIRIGYLAARVIQDKIVIVTFLFLTMEGTPENRLLKRILGVTSHDIRFMRLDRLETYLTPDVIADERLMGVLEKCGCGQLRNLERFRSDEATERGRAEKIKQYLGLGEADGSRRWDRLLKGLIPETNQKTNYKATS